MTYLIIAVTVLALTEISGCNEIYFILGESNIRMCMKKYFRKINFNYRGENDDEIEEII